MTGRGERIGLFGGTFDPPHVGHLAAAVNARHDLGLDVVLLVVANVPWQKVGERVVSPASVRLELVRLAVGDVEGVEVCDLEIRRGGPSYTADTVRELFEEDPSRELYVIVGSDAAAGLPTWERVDEVRQRAVIAVVDRPGGSWGPPRGWDVERVEVPRLEISSTDLRDRVVDGRPLDYLVPAPVVSGIERLGLYRDDR
ncbi:MAG: nicotinate (nicotinamide) nucleotide adenylyltransferase [Acidimicrobiales bacterium]|nr:nicotinate (nicotinamide) nucleotide adenylyltransferase [Acidimicrobiales bacterium]